MKLFEAPSAHKLVLHTLLVRGGAFQARYEFLNEGLKSRLFVIANLKPANDDKIILFSPTTQIEKRRKHHGERADLLLVPLDPAEYDGVTEHCVIDCESPVKRKRSDFIKHVEDHNYVPRSTMPASAMTRIVDAVRESRTLSPAEKRLILGPVDSADT